MGVARAQSRKRGTWRGLVCSRVVRTLVVVLVAVFVVVQVLLHDPEQRLWPAEQLFSEHEELLTTNNDVSSHIRPPLVRLGPKIDAIGARVGQALDRLKIPKIGGTSKSGVEESYRDQSSGDLDISIVEAEQNLAAGDISPDGQVGSHDRHHLYSENPVEVVGNPKFGYVFYVTDDQYACSALVNIDRLQQLKTQHHIYVLATADLAYAYREAFKERNATISYQEIPPLPEDGAWYYRNCMVKLLAFKMHHIDPLLRRVLVLDADQLIMKNMDYLFESLPIATIAAPHAYWVDKSTFSSTFMMIDLSERLWDMVEHAMKSLTPKKYDMDILNELFGDTVTMLPGSFVTLNSHWETWTLPGFYTTEEDFSNVTVESPKEPKPPTRIAESVVDENLGHAGKNFHTPAQRVKPSRTFWRMKRGVTPLQGFDHTHPTNLPSVQAEDSDTALHTLPAVPVHDGSGNSRKRPVEGATSLTAADLLLVKEQRPRYEELHLLLHQASVIHFYALGKPWNFNSKEYIRKRPEAHPVFYYLFQEWRANARMSCPEPSRYAS